MVLQQRLDELTKKPIGDTEEPNLPMYEDLERDASLFTKAARLVHFSDARSDAERDFSEGLAGFMKVSVGMGAVYPGKKCADRMDIVRPKLPSFGTFGTFDVIGQNRTRYNLSLHAYAEKYNPYMATLMRFPSLECEQATPIPIDGYAEWPGQEWMPFQRGNSGWIVGQPNVTVN